MTDSQSDSPDTTEPSLTSENPHGDGVEGEGELAEASQIPKKPRLGKSRAFTSEMSQALISKDRWTRRMALVFFGACLGIAAVIYFGAERAIRHHRVRLAAEKKSANRLGQFFKEQAEAARLKSSLLALGVFTIELKVDDGDAVMPIRRGVKTAEIEVVLECETVDVSRYIESHMLQARNELTETMVGLTRDGLFSRDGKAVLRKKMVDRLNQWMPEGKVRNVYFNKLIVM